MGRCSGPDGPGDWRRFAGGERCQTEEEGSGIVMLTTATLGDGGIAGGDVKSGGANGVEGGCAHGVAQVTAKPMVAAERRGRRRWRR